MNWRTEYSGNAFTAKWMFGKMKIQAQENGGDVRLLDDRGYTRESYTYQSPPNGQPRR